jgi:hypothetical protein
MGGAGGGSTIASGSYFPLNGQNYMWEQRMTVDWVKVNQLTNGGGGGFPNTATDYCIKRANQNGWLSARNDANFDVETRGACGGWEKWRFVDAGGGNWYIRSYAHGARNLQAYNGNDARTSPNTGDWEKFQLVNLGGGKYRLKNPYHGVHVQVPDGGDVDVQASPNQGTWEELTFTAQ